MSKIESVGGLQIRTFSPLAGVKLADADERELAAYGLPFRPDPKRFPRAYRQWMRTASRPFRYVPARFLGSGGHRKDGSVGRRIENTTLSASWAGSAVTPQPGDAFQWVAGIWTIPNVYPYGAQKDGTVYDLSEWVGIGGFGEQLLQAGTHQSVAVSGGAATARDCFLWYMVYPGFALQMVALDVAPGDQMNMVVCSTAANSARFFALNETSGEATSWDIMPTNGINITGNSAEWIVEDPSVNERLAPLPRFSEIFFEGTVAGTRNGDGDFTAAEGELYVLADDLSKPLVTPVMDGDLLRIVQDF